MEILKVEEGLIIWEIIAFIGLFLVLKRFAWAPLLGILNEREETIRESLDKAEQTRVEAERLMEDYKQQLSEARAEAQKIIEQSRQFGESLKSEIVNKAKTEAEQILAEGKADIGREKDAALAELQHRVADLTVDAASRVVMQSFDQKNHYQLIEEYLSEVGSLGEN